MNCFKYSTENQEKEDKPKEEEAKEPVVEEKPKTRSSRPKEATPAFMSSLFALLDIYRTKMLVSLLTSFIMCFSSVVINSASQLGLVGNQVIFLLELPGSQLLQLAFPGSVCVFCHQLHSSVLQGNSNFCPIVVQILIGISATIKRQCKESEY